MGSPEIFSKTKNKNNALIKNEKDMVSLEQGCQTCGPGAKCGPPKTKPGQCPLWTIEGIPSENACKYDEDCPGNYKCCNSHLGPTCVHPVPIMSFFI
uniref:WAP domain-containing protein n=1 Tax=Sphaeramia orbicularis TaxID=375764 RepID=A0A672YRY8_9TELE